MVLDLDLDLVSFRPLGLLDVVDDGPDLVLYALHSDELVEILPDFRFSARYEYLSCHILWLDLV